MSTVGQLHVCYLHEGEIKVEWKIENFLSNLRTVPVCIESPDFFFCDTPWNIIIFRNIHYNNAVGILIQSHSYVPESMRAFSLHLKRIDGELDTYAKCINTNASKSNHPFGSVTITSLPNLIERKSELLPKGCLTVICTLKTSGTTHVGAAGNATNDKITKTKEGTAENATNDEFTKMKEGTDLLKLQQHFEEIFQNGNFSDVVLKVDGQEFKCHKCVLARSPVFSAMMSHEMKEKNTGVVDIQDDNPNTFYDFLHYLYTGNKEIIKSERIVNLFTAADKYQVDELKKSCLDYMLKNISVDNFCDVLSLSLVHVEKDLTDACSQFYIKNSLSIVITPKWLEFMIKHPVAANELNIKQLKSSMEIKN